MNGSFTEMLSVDNSSDPGTAPSRVSYSISPMRSYNRNTGDPGDAEPRQGCKRSL